MDGLDVLGPVQVCLVGGEDGEGAAHHSYGRHRRGAEPEYEFREANKFEFGAKIQNFKKIRDSHAEVERGHGPVWVGDALRDGVGEGGEEGDGAEGEHVEGVATADLVRYASPASRLRWKSLMDVFPT